MKQSLIGGLSTAFLLLGAVFVIAQESSPPGAPLTAPTWRVGQSWRVQTLLRERSLDAHGSLRRGPRLPGLPVLHDGVPEGWKRGSAWKLLVSRVDVAVVGSRTLRHAVVSLTNEADPSRGAELWFDANTRALARITVPRDGVPARDPRSRWLRGDVAHGEPESHQLAFPLDWPDWKRIDSPRSAYELDGRERVQTTELDKGLLRICLAEPTAPSRNVVQEWRAGDPWWLRSIGPDFRAELVENGK